MHAAHARRTQATDVPVVADVGSCCFAPRTRREFHGRRRAKPAVHARCGMCARAWSSAASCAWPLGVGPLASVAWRGAPAVVFSCFQRAPTGGKTDRPPKPPTSLLQHLLAFTGMTTGTQPTNQPHQAPNPHGQPRPPQYRLFRTPSLRATFLRRPLAPRSTGGGARLPRCTRGVGCARARGAAPRAARGHWRVVRLLLLSLGAARLLSSSSRFQRAPTGGKTDRPPKPPTSLLRHLLAFTGMTTGTQPTNQLHQAPNPHGRQSRPSQYRPFRTPSLRATFLRRPLVPPARAVHSRRPLAPPARAVRSRRNQPSPAPGPHMANLDLPSTAPSAHHHFAPPSCAAGSRRPLAPSTSAARSRRPLAPPSRAALSRRPLPPLEPIQNHISSLTSIGSRAR